MDAYLGSLFESCLSLKQRKKRGQRVKYVTKVPNSIYEDIGEKQSRIYGALILSTTCVQLGYISNGYGTGRHWQTCYHY